MQAVALLMSTSSPESRRAPILVVLGPTGSGKSELALSLARRFQGEIVNCDSIQVYKGLDIGSAKTPLASRSDVPHHLLDVIGPGEELTAGAYARLAREAIRSIHEHGSLPIVAGGTGFYLRALLDGLSPAPPRDAQIRSRLQQIASSRPAVLYRVLRRYDSAAAERIHPNDMPKLIRAIEIMLLSGQTTTAVQSARRQALTGVSVLKLGLLPDRRRLYSHLNGRSAWLFENGLVEETERLMALGYAADSKALQSVGYKQAVRVILGYNSREAAITECQTKTRQYAKRQITWFRAERDVHWIEGFGSDAKVQRTTAELTRNFLLACGIETVC
jgi:tRNA dimethylallyltransferase